MKHKTISYFLCITFLIAGLFSFSFENANEPLLIESAAGLTVYSPISINGNDEFKTFAEGNWII